MTNPQSGHGSSSNVVLSEPLARARGTIILQLVLPALLAGLGLGIWLALIGFIPEALRDRIDGWVQHICVYLLLWHILIMIMRWLNVVRPERQALHQPFLGRSNTSLDADRLQRAAEEARNWEKATGPRMITRRIILGAANFCGRGDPAELSQFMERRAEADRQRAEDGYAVPRFIFWSIPILGFIGTVIGIGDAIRGLSSSEVFSTAEISSQIAHVASALGIAFNTTMVALILSIVVLLVQTLIYQLEMRLHDEIEDRLIERLEGRLQVAVADQTQLVDNIRRLNERLGGLVENIDQGTRNVAQAQTQIEERLRQALEQVPETLRSSSSDVANAIAEACRPVLAASEELPRSVSLLGRDLSQAVAETCHPLIDKLATVSSNLSAVQDRSEDLLRIEHALKEGLATVHTSGRLDAVLDILAQQLSGVEETLKASANPQVGVCLSFAGAQIQAAAAATGQDG